MKFERSFGSKEKNPSKRKGTNDQDDIIKEASIVDETWDIID